MNDTPTYLIYVRQSLTRDGDDSLSMAFQERSLRELAAKRGGVVLDPPITEDRRDHKVLTNA